MEGMKNTAIEWFVNFARLDLEKLGPGDRAKLEVEAGLYLFPAPDGPWYVADTGEMHPASIPLVVTSAGRFAEPGGEMTWADRLPYGRTPEYWSMIVASQKTVLDTLKRFTKEFGEFRSMNPSFLSFRVREKFEIQMHPITDNHSDYVIIKLYMALDGLPVACLQTCQSCERIFFNPSKRAMKYCSTRCLSRFNARKRREADREGYNKKQREIMRRKYERDAKKRVAPKVKIARRKTKDTSVDK